MKIKWYFSLFFIILAVACGGSTTSHATTGMNSTKHSPFPGTASNIHIPDTLSIPTLSLAKITVEQVGKDSQNNMAIPSSSSTTGWYRFGPAPGMNGDAVIDGHKDWYDTKCAVFCHLDQLTIGAEIDILSYDGAILIFRVTNKVSVSYNTDTSKLGLFQFGGSPRLSLVTCDGSWTGRTYTNRLIVNAQFLGTSN
jgi:sortase (surface protein transpeptidase)